jgi:hypothetical protein
MVKNCCVTSQVWWCLPVIPVLRQEDRKFQGSLELHSKTLSHKNKTKIFYFLGI